MEEPGSFSGRVISPRPQRGPLPSQRTSVRDFHERTGERLERAAGHDDGIVRGKRREFVRRGDERVAGELRDLFRHACGEFGMGVEARADGAATEGELGEVGQDHLDALEIGVEHGDVAGKFLAEREWCRVHQVGAADFHDGLEFLRLGVERVAQHFYGGEQCALRLERGGDRHGAGEGVVGRLRHVHVVVRVHRLLGAKFTAGHLDRAVGDDLVDVHVALRAAAGLPDAEWEMAVEFTGGNFVRGFHDQVGDFGLHLAEVEIHQRAGLLQHAEGMHDLERHAVRADVEMDQGPCRLRAVIAVVRHGNLAHAVGFQAVMGGDVRRVNGVRHRAATVAAVRFTRYAKNSRMRSVCGCSCTRKASWPRGAMMRWWMASRLAVRAAWVIASWRAGE